MNLFSGRGSKRRLKQILGELPFTAELYWQIRQQGRPLSKSFSLRRVEKYLPTWLAQAEAARQAGNLHAEVAPKRILIFGTLLYWIEHAVLLGLAQAGQGHDVTLAYLPYANWRKPFNRFDLRRQNAYARSVLSQAAPLLKSVSFLDVGPAGRGAHRDLDSLPLALADAVREISLRDAQYTLQVEDVDLDSPLYHLRLERNAQAAAAALVWMQAEAPDVVITPNGSILEMGAVYQVARYLNIPVVTYEFGEQRGRIWLAHDDEVMRQETGPLWDALQDRPLTPAQWDQIRALFASRQRGDLWENFSRLWQGLPNQGGEKVRQGLGLDNRPVVVLAANVIGDSLTLGRQVFSRSMTEWLERTVQFFAARPEVQLVVRIHPGERYTTGPSVADVVKRALPDLDSHSGHIRLIAAGDPINTYDLLEIADLGLAYTTTVGLEMAMSGVPLILAGQTHYRGKGFTLDPTSWDSYFALLQNALAELAQPAAPAAYRLSKEQVEQAWQYAYRFFFDFPLPFPWHLVHMWKEVAEPDAWTLERVLSPQGQAEFGPALRCLAGEPRDWTWQRPLPAAASAEPEAAQQHAGDEMVGVSKR